MLLGIVTTHYLNLKVMANKTLASSTAPWPLMKKICSRLYKLIIGKPGSSYTFSIAERIGLDQRTDPTRADLVEEDHFRLDKLLNRTEQDLQTRCRRKKKNCRSFCKKMKS